MVAVLSVKLLEMWLLVVLPEMRLLVILLEMWWHEVLPEMWWPDVFPEMWWLEVFPEMWWHDVFPELWLLVVSVVVPHGVLCVVHSLVEFGSSKIVAFVVDLKICQEQFLVY